MKRKDNYVMRKLNIPKRVTLPNSRTFLTTYKCVPRSKLLPHITIRRRYRQRTVPRGRKIGGQRGFVKKV